jgi:peptidoglycan/LPS O-acetylase OafA/YrhL
MTDARPADPTTPISKGDALAETGDWPAAIEAWRCAVRAQPELRPAVERRLEWFLTETGSPAGARNGVLPLALACLAATALGMAFLMLAGEPGSTGANLWALATWVMIGVAIVAALLAARRSGDAPLTELIDRARRSAERLNDAATGEMK